MQAAEMTKREKVRAITKDIRYAEKRLRRRFGWLKHQNSIGMAIFLGAASAMVVTTILYIQGILPAWAAIIGNAIFASLLHELEHDLIHSLYFKDRWQDKLMMYGVWIFRGNTPNPYFRKELHLRHHRESGQEADIEEQIIGNGMKYNFKRFLVMVDPTLAFLINFRRLKRKISDFDVKALVASARPVQSIFTLLWNLFIGFNIFTLLNYLVLNVEVSSTLATAGAIINIIGVVYLLPNFIHRFCLHFVTTSMHYFGDVTPGKEGLAEQTQILKPWYMLPFQLFCFNFGSTHGIHHFVVNQPFYLRQMIAATAHAAMIKYGVRKNDFGTFKRANRYTLVEQEQEMPTAMAAKAA